MPANTLQDAEAAALPPEALALLAELRALPGVRVATVNDRAWVRWEPGEDRALRRLLAVPGAEFYVRRQGRWYRAGCSLPAFQFPDQAGFRSLDQVLFPAPFQAVPPPETEPRPVTLRIVADHRPRPASALECGLAELARWADTVPACCLAALQAAVRERRVLLLGARLPPLAGARRYWGQRVLLPLGYRPEPDWPEDALREALGVGEDELLVLGTEKSARIARSVFRPLTRAAVRLACPEVG